MAVYTIKDIEKLTGIKAHTLRVWEQRYGVIKPNRTATNIRYYSDEDLRKVMNIALLNRNGIKISKIVGMTAAEIQENVATFTTMNTELAVQLDALSLSVVEMDEYKFNKIIQVHIEQNGFGNTMLNVLFPLIEKLNLLWLTGSITPAQEVFMSNLVKQKILTAIDKESSTLPKIGKKFLLFLPRGERQDLTLLYLHFLIKSKGFQSIYLGSELSIADLTDANRFAKPDFLLTIATESMANSGLPLFIKTLRENFSNSHLLMTGYQPIAQGIESENKLTIFKNLQEAVSFLDLVGPSTDSEPHPSKSR